MNLFFVRLMGQMLIFRKKIYTFSKSWKRDLCVIFAQLKIFFYPYSRTIIILYSDHFAPYFYTICEIVKYVFI